MWTFRRDVGSMRTMTRSKVDGGRAADAQLHEVALASRRNRRLPRDSCGREWRRESRPPSVPALRAAPSGARPACPRCRPKDGPADVEAQADGVGERQFHLRLLAQGSEDAQVGDQPAARPDDGDRLLRGEIAFLEERAVDGEFAAGAEQSFQVFPAEVQMARGRIDAKRRRRRDGRPRRARATILRTICSISERLTGAAERDVASFDMALEAERG